MVTFDEQVALVTGAGSGIGQALGRELLARGARVAFTDRNVESLEAADGNGAGGRSMFLPLDVTDEADWDAVAAAVETRLGPIDILCNNAGVVGVTAAVADAQPDDFRWLYEVNVIGALHGVRRTVPGMRKRGRGWVLHTVSFAGLDSVPGHADYSASKHAALSLCEAMRDELADSGVGVSALCPSAVATRIMTTSQQSRPSRFGSPASLATEVADPGAAAARLASGGAMSPDEVARIALDGVRDGRFYIFTHPQSEQRLRKRMDEMLAAFGTGS